MTKSRLIEIIIATDKHLMTETSLEGLSYEGCCGFLADQIIQELRKEIEGAKRIKRVGDTDYDRAYNFGVDSSNKTLDDLLEKIGGKK